MFKFRLWFNKMILLIVDSYYIIILI